MDRTPLGVFFSGRPPCSRFYFLAHAISALVGRLTAVRVYSVSVFPVRREKRVRFPRPVVTYRAQKGALLSSLSTRTQRRVHRRCTAESRASSEIYFRTDPLASAERIGQNARTRTP